MRRNVLVWVFYSPPARQFTLRYRKWGPFIYSPAEDAQPQLLARPRYHRARFSGRRTTGFWWLR